tara:strand:+ start:14317 stop:15684 length:1368 start_codon:yes stop_codon:yes gene_type:complete
MDLNFPTDETIAAIATAISAGKGGIAIVRISGPLAQQIGQEIIQISGTQDWDSHKVLYGHVMDKANKEVIDEVLVLTMTAPRTFTGEDVVEIHCHGGVISVQRVLARILEYPQVRRAYPGEFSQRAVLNGRLDLTQAEAINDLISARNKKAAQLAISGISGAITKRINTFRERLLILLSEIEARVDFEDELPPLDQNQLLNDFAKVQQSLQELIKDSKQGSFIKNGIKVALIGLPNVGKSSLLNRLCKQERAIVTDLPGTTRDVLEVEIELENVPITLFDTAGIRKSDNQIEKLGIAKSQETLKAVDIVILIFDLNRGWSPANEELFEQIPEHTPKLIVGNKADLPKKSTPMKPYISISALTGEGEYDLVKNLLSISGAYNTEDLNLSLNERQLDLAIAAEAALGRIQDMVHEKLPWDFWTIDLREAINKLGELAGEEITESLLDKIFSRFCIGK